MLDMTDQHLNEELAKWLGYTMVFVGGEPKYARVISPEGKLVGKTNTDTTKAWAGAIPNYCNDPAASLEVQAVAINKDEEGYIRNWLLNKYGKSVMAFTAVSLGTAAEIANSSPRERAEAAYMTLSSRD
ncbi:hypothetical protein [Paenibacillus polymyxa]|uniref:hypothetical protein n=1 Tax=Paenibacillus polymyxa TaxID=1406 RepID=UPI0006C5205C|nr:hypothetical protein [Paenibacillus polymyxa]KOS02986.1 hypothetical protein AM598_09215 [Paenibacillus polymyxa]